VTRLLVLIAALFVAVTTSATASADVAAPWVSVRRLDRLPTPLPYPFNERQSEAAAMAEVDAAFARARSRGTRVLVDFGGNWCGWCRILEAVIDLPEVKPFVEQHYEVVHVYTSSGGARTDRNLRILARFGLRPGDIEGYPWVVVATADGDVLHSSYEITDDRHQTPQAMVNWLAEWAR
jgi:thiol:disulfide interchange protein